MKSNHMRLFAGPVFAVILTLLMSPVHGFRDVDRQKPVAAAASPEHTERSPGGDRAHELEETRVLDEGSAESAIKRQSTKSAPSDSRNGGEELSTGSNPGNLGGPPAR